mmetsp:Transcript_59384/g.150449  ORF Transcript_59384/g.150449 Transcript_59384/m.150449 type:complete len:257 (-) Transcript_59384:53-823(-)
MHLQCLQLEAKDVLEPEEADQTPGGWGRMADHRECTTAATGTHRSRVLFVLMAPTEHMNIAEDPGDGAALRGGLKGESVVPQENVCTTPFFHRDHVHCRFAHIARERWAVGAREEAEGQRHDSVASRGIPSNAEIGINHQAPLEGMAAGLHVCNMGPHTDAHVLHGIHHGTDGHLQLRKEITIQTNVPALLIISPITTLNCEYWFRLVADACPEGVVESLILEAPMGFVLKDDAHLEHIHRRTKTATDSKTAPTAA